MVFSDCWCHRQQTCCHLFSLLWLWTIDEHWWNEGFEVLIFGGTLTPTPGLENLGLWTPTLIRLQLRLYDLLCHIVIVYLRMTREKF